MKLGPNTTRSTKSGMTLLELTVVILVLLSLIGILFIGARAWKRGSDRTPAASSTSAIPSRRIPKPKTDS